MNNDTKWLLAGAAGLAALLWYAHRAGAATRDALTPAQAENPGAIPPSMVPVGTITPPPPLGHVGYRIAEKVQPLNPSDTSYYVSFFVADASGAAKKYIARFATVKLPTATLGVLYVPDATSAPPPELAYAAGSEARPDQAAIIDQAVMSYLQKLPEALRTDV